MPQFNARISQWLSHLSLRRIITSNRFIPEIDGFRFIAIFIVAMSHIYGQLGPLPVHGRIARITQDAFRVGGHGVYLFFTISGFILALPFARHHLQGGNPVRLGNYFRRRVTRLEPPYILVMLLRAPALLFVKSTTGAVVLVHLLASLFYVHNLVYGEGSSINPPAWSLEIEIQFYLLTPLLTAIFIIRNKTLRRTFIVIAMALAGVLSTLYIHPASRLGFSIANFLQFFLAGFLLVDLYLVNDRLPIPSWLWDLIALASLGWILWSQSFWYLALMPFVTVCLYMAGFRGRLARAFFAWTPISTIGGMCYSIYLTHTAILSAMHPVVRRLEHLSLPPVVYSFALTAICLAAMLAVGTVFFLLVERPCMDPAWPQKLLARLKARA